MKDKLNTSLAVDTHTSASIKLSWWIDTSMNNRLPESLIMRPSLSDKVKQRPFR